MSDHVTEAFCQVLSPHYLTSSLQQPYETGPTSIAILQMRKLKPEKVSSLLKGKGDPRIGYPSGC